MQCIPKYRISLLCAILCFFAFNFSVNAATVETDYGNASISIKKIDDRVFTEVESAGKLLFGSGRESEPGRFESSAGSLRFLPGSFFFKMQESSIIGAYQMSYPVIRDLSNSSRYLVPLIEFGTALSSNRFEFQALEGDKFHLRRLPSYLAELAAVDISKAKRQAEPGINNTDSSPQLPMLRKAVHKSGDEDKYSYARLRPLPKSEEDSRFQSRGHEFEIPKIDVDDRKEEESDIPVFENGIMDYTPLEKEKTQTEPKPRQVKRNKEQYLRMGAAPGDTIAPPPINYELPEGIYRREIEEELEKRQSQNLKKK